MRTRLRVRNREALALQKRCYCCFGLLLEFLICNYAIFHNGLSMWPYMGYGHMKLPGEKYYKGYKMSGCEADALLRQDLKKFCALYSSYGKDSVLLGALAYNCGPGIVNKSTVLKKLKSGDRNIFRAYTSHSRYKGKFHKGLYTRRCMEIAVLYMK